MPPASNMQSGVYLKGAGRAVPGSVLDMLTCEDRAPALDSGPCASRPVAVTGGHGALLPAAGMGVATQWRAGPGLCPVAPVPVTGQTQKG